MSNNLPTKTLVIILSETRANELTFKSIKKNVIDELNADLCICIGITKDYDYNNEFYKLAKYKFLYDEPDDFGDAFEYAYQEICKKDIKILQDQDHLHWRNFLKIKDQFLGGIKDEYYQHPGSAGILIFFRWFLMQKILENNLLEMYNRFIITRSDYIWLLPHPKIELLSENNIWIPNSEDYGGVTDRHVVLSKSNIISYLNILDNFVIKSADYYNKLKYNMDWNLEKIIRFHLHQEGIFYKVLRFPYIMYTVRAVGGTTRWSAGTFSEEHQYYIKYGSEYYASNYYKNKFNGFKNNIFYKLYYFFFENGTRLKDFYKKEISNINDDIHNYSFFCNYLSLK
jgi:hypothetical protein